MSTQEWRLRNYITNVLNRQDNLVEFVYKDNEIKLSEIDPSIGVIKFTPGGNLEKYLRIIVEEMFESFDGRYSGKIYHAAVLFIYCIKISDFFMEEVGERHIDLLTDALVDVLMGIGFEIPASNYKICRKTHCIIPLAIISFSLFTFYCYHYF